MLHNGQGFGSISDIHREEGLLGGDYTTVCTKPSAWPHEIGSAWLTRSTSIIYTKKKLQYGEAKNLH